MTSTSGPVTYVQPLNSSEEIGGIIVEDLVFGYPENPPILNHLSLKIRPGERVALLGPTGTGKSTLMEHLVGLKEPATGKIYIQGKLVEPNSLWEIRQQIGFCFQNPADQLFMPTIFDDVIFGPCNYGVPAPVAVKRAEKLLSQFGLSDCAQRACHQLSGGQKRLAALATVLALEPTILILDEPTAGLDPLWRRYLIKVLEQLPVQILLIVSHNLNWIRKTTDRALILSAGKIQVDQLTSRLLEQEQLLESYGLPLD